MDLISDSDYIKIIDDGTNRSVVQREVHQLVPSLHFNILHFGHKVISVAEPFGPDTDVYILVSLYIYSIRLLATENYITVLELGRNNIDRRISQERSHKLCAWR